MAATHEVLGSPCWEKGCQKAKYRSEVSAMEISFSQTPGDWLGFWGIELELHSQRTGFVNEAAEFRGGQGVVLGDGCPELELPGRHRGAGGAWEGNRSLRNPHGYRPRPVLALGIARCLKSVDWQNRHPVFLDVGLLLGSDSESEL